MSQVHIENIDVVRIDVGGGVSIPKSWDAVAAGEPNVPGAIRVHVVFDERLRRTAAASVRLDRAGEGDEVTSAALREVRVQYVVQHSSVRLVGVTRRDGKPMSLRNYLDELKSRSERTDQETLLEAVTLYRVAATVNLAPLKLVSDQLGVSVSTATRWMARARDAGLADDLITRETYNRIRAGEDQQAAPIASRSNPSGPAIGI
ncbi:hypothetical protein [Glutamicibacter protophormiae]|uniref:hypothetical protein n=1 Tax=Glutamicibacter protophormiae TaxID=37930 RepID=UPI003A9100CC